MFKHRLYKIKSRFSFFILLIFIISYSASSKDLIVKEIKNEIKIIDKYGNNFFLKQNYILKNGDFLQSLDKNSYLVFDKIKICLGKNSSIKINQIKLNSISLEHRAGSLLINNQENNKINFQVDIFKNLILNFKNKLYTKQINKTQFIIRSFSRANFKPYNNQNVTSLKKNETYKFDQLITKTLIKNISEDPLIQNCLTNKKYFETNYQKSFKCTSKFSRLICCFQ